MRGLATVPKASRSECSETGIEYPQEHPSGALRLRVCSSSALLSDLLGVSTIRSTERDLSVLSIYLRIFLCVFIVYHLLLETLVAYAIAT